MVVGSWRLAVTHAGRRRTWSVGRRGLALVGDIRTRRFITATIRVQLSDLDFQPFYIPILSDHFFYTHI